jgi:hypothetical protein
VEKKRESVDVDGGVGLALALFGGAIVGLLRRIVR